MMGTLVLSKLWTLCDLELDGGGPGGGGGMAILESSLVCEPDRERADVGVSIAPADIALRALGGPGWEQLETIERGLTGSGVYKPPGPMLCLADGAW